MRDGVRIVNAARGELVDEPALADAIRSGKVAGAALDVFSAEPYEGELLELENVVTTPHLAASTEEAQDRAGLIVAEQVVAALDGGLVTNAVNIPVVGAEDLEVLGPYIPLAAKLGRLAVELAGGHPRRIGLSFNGGIAGHDTRLLTVAALNGAFQGRVDQAVNYVNAPVIAAERGIEVTEQRSGAARDYTNLVTVAVDDVEVSGTTIGPEPRLFLAGALGFAIDLQLSPRMVFFRYDDVPGVIGRVGTMFGEAGVNIANMAVSRTKEGGKALMALAIDSEPPAELVERIRGGGLRRCPVHRPRLARGGGWVGAQFALMAAILVLGAFPPVWPRLAAGSPGSALILGGLGFAIWAGRTLGSALTPYPRPNEQATLVEHGPYGLVRHPIYVAGLLVFLGYGLLASVPATAAVPLLAVLWHFKAGVEERHLAERFPGVRRLQAPRPPRDLGRARGLSLRAIGATSGCRFATTARSPSARTIASIRSSSCPLTSRKVAPSSRTRSYSSSVASTRSVQVGSAHSQTNFVSSASNRSADSAIRSFTSRKSDSVRAIFSPSLLFKMPPVCRIAVERDNEERPSSGFAPAGTLSSCARSWPEPVERVAAYLRAAGAEARLEELESGTATAEDAARAAGCPIGQIVKSIVVLCDGRPVVALVPGDRRVDLAKIALAAGAVEARIARGSEVEEATGFAPGAVAPFPLPERRSRADRPEPARPRHGLGRRGLRHPHGRHEPERPRSARPRAADGRRPRLHLRLQVRSRGDA